MKKKLVNIASRLFPKAISDFAYQQLTNPQIRKLRKNELATLDNATKEKFDFKGFAIQLYIWKGGDKSVLLIHGWEGQAGNFSDLIEILLAHDYTVYAFDGPSHGFSSRGSTSLFEFTELVGILIRKFQVKTLVSHSFGGVAATYALYGNQDLEIDTYVLLTTPDRFSERIDDVSEAVGINQNVKKRLISRLENETGLSINTLNVSDFVKQINVKRALIFHDTNDKVIPIARSKNVHSNWNNCEFKEVEGTGHFRILRTPEILNQVVDYLETSNND